MTVPFSHQLTVRSCSGRVFQNLAQLRHSSPGLGASELFCFLAFQGPFTYWSTP